MRLFVFDRRSVAKARMGSRYIATAVHLHVRLCGSGGIQRDAKLTNAVEHETTRFNNEGEPGLALKIRRESRCMIALLFRIKFCLKKITCLIHNLQRVHKCVCGSTY